MLVKGVLESYMNMLKKIKILATAQNIWRLDDDIMSWQRFVDQSTFVMGIHRWLSEM